MTAFKTYNDALAIPPKFIFTPTLENYVSLWHSAFSASFVNSLLSASLSTALALGTLTRRPRARPVRPPGAESSR